MATLLFRCPVCGTLLEEQPRRYCCVNGHSFDRAKSGYVNLLRRQSHRLRGDDPSMVAARRAFLDAGFYQPLLDAIGELLLKERPRCIADIGCGEGWYACNLLQLLHQNGVEASLCGVDISVDALRYASHRARAMGEMLYAHTAWAAATIGQLPFADAACDCILNLFAPVSADEFARVLRPAGLLVRAVPLERHLWQLKAAVYAQPYENRPVLEAPAGFLLESVRRIETTVTLCGADLQHLFAMTPYVRKTAPADAVKLAAMESLTTELAFGVLVCRRVVHPHG